MNDLSMTKAKSMQTYDGASVVLDFPVTVKRITTTDDGRLQLVMEAQSLEDESLAQVQRMLELQRGAALLTLVPAQGSLLLEVPAPEKASRSQ